MAFNFTPGTSLLYNGVLMRDCELLDFDQRIIYDESNTDVVYSKFSIRVASTLIGLVQYAGTFKPTPADFNREHPSTVWILDDMSDQNMPSRLVEIQTRMQEDRKDFALSFGSNVFEDGRDPPNTYNSVLLASGEISDTQHDIFTYTNVTSGPPGPRSDYLDVNNGPKPLECKIQHLFGGRSVRLEFAIEVCVCKCSGDGKAEPPESSLEAIGKNFAVLNNRWSLSESKDDDWKTTRTIAGTLRVRDQRYWAHAMRYLVVPPLLNGYKRVSQEFANDKTGLTLTYSIKDREENAAPPPGCIEWSGQYTITQGEGQAMFIHDCSVSVTGPPGADKSILLGSAINVVLKKTGWDGARLARPQGLAPREAILIDTMISENIREPIVDLRIVLRMLPLEADNEAFNLVADVYNFIGKPLALEGYNQKIWPVPQLFDSSSPAGIFSCYLQSPCSGWHSIPKEHDEVVAVKAGVGSNYNQVTDGPGADDRQGTNWRSYRYDVVFPDTPPRPKNISQEHYRAPFTHIEIDDGYDTNNGFIGLPLSASRVVDARTGQIAPPSSGSSSRPTYSQTAAIIRLHQPITTYTIKLVATRENDWPKIPDPGEMFYLGAGPGTRVEVIPPTNPPSPASSSGIRAIRTAMNIVLETPRNGPDQTTQIYKIHAVLKYTLDRNLTPQDSLRYTGNPITKASLANLLPVRNLTIGA